jgi:hypothetical protein
MYFWKKTLERNGEARCRYASIIPILIYYVVGELSGDG